MIEIQNEQLKCNGEKFQFLQTAVKSTVQETESGEQLEIKSNSSALKEK